MDVCLIREVNHGRMTPEEAVKAEAEKSKPVTADKPVKAGTKKEA